jgi:hypothetical protein
MKKLLLGAVLITFTLTAFGMNKENESGSSNNASDEDWKLV